MLRVVNPFVGKAFMAYNPRKKYRRRPSSLSRSKRYRRVKGSLARRGFGMFRGKGGKARMIHFGKKRRTARRSNPRRRRNFMEAAVTPARTILPNVRELTQEAQTALVGAGAFMVSNALGVGVNKLIGMLPAQFSGPVQSLMGLIKFAGRYIGARALSSMVFKAPSGILSKENGAVVKEIVVITGGLALMHDFGLVAALPQGIQALVPSISGMNALERMGIQKYVHGGTLSKYVHGGTLGEGYYPSGSQMMAYTRGTPRMGISSYANYGNGGWSRMSPPQAAALGQLPPSLERMPLETPETANYGIPFGH